MVAVCLAWGASATVVLPKILGSNMVLQQSSEVKLWGKCDADKSVTVVVSWAKGKIKTKADDKGNWSVRVATPAGSYDKHTITISDGEPLVLENVMFPLDMFSDKPFDDRLKRARFCLERVNLLDAQYKSPSELSGGMQKRAAIARAIALEPRYLFCDEPNSGLDPKTSLIIDELIHNITEEYGITTIVNTHDMNSVMGIGDNIIFLAGGRKAWEGTKDEILYSNNDVLNEFLFSSDLLRKVRDGALLKV